MTLPVMLAAYLASAVVFLAADAVMLSQVMRPLFERHLGPELREAIRIGPAAAFYLFYLGVLMVLVTVPAVGEGWSWGKVALHGALIGAAAYGTYEFTSYAVMTRWHWSMVVVDLAWGTVLTAVVALTGVAAARTLAG